MDTGAKTSYTQLDFQGEVIDETRITSAKMEGIEQAEGPLAPKIQRHRDTVKRKTEEIIKQKGLPECGESRVWVNTDQPDKLVENPEKPEVKMLSWNIERGYKVDEQIDYLKQTNPDIICLQEVDWDCERTGNQNIALKIAKEAKYKYVVYTTEFLELDGSKKDFPLSLREKLNKIGKGGGAHGHALLSKHPITNVSAIKLDNLWHDWEGGDTEMSKREPRKGQRVAQRIDIKIGNKNITIYNTHFEDKTNTGGRLVQWDQVAKDAEKAGNSVVITGDLNTISHGIANVLPTARNNFFGRNRKLGQKDSEFWRESEFQSLSAGRKKTYNDPTTDPTFSIGPAYKAKLDWILLQDGKFAVKESSLGTSELSDHRPVIVTSIIE